MSVRVATVLSAREWEPGLVAHARDHGSVRVVVRAYRPDDIDSRLNEIDVVVAGGDVSWVTSAHIERWRSAGTAVVGVAPDGDLPAERLLAAGGADEVVSESIPIAALLQAVRFAAPAALRGTQPSVGRLVAVTGARGSPGITEVAIGLALSRGADRNLLLGDLDLSAPAIAVRLGLPARPDITDAADAARASGEVTSDHVHRFRGIDVMTGSHRRHEPPLRQSLLDGLADVVVRAWDEVVVDLGTGADAMNGVARADDVVLVVEGSAIGVVRAAQLVDRWVGPVPAIVLNRVDRSQEADLRHAVEQWTGLAPALVLPERSRVRRAARTARPTERRFLRALSSLGG